MNTIFKKLKKNSNFSQNIKPFILKLLHDSWNKSRIMTQQEIYNCFFDSLQTLTKYSDKDKEFRLKVFKPFELAKDEIYQKIGEIPRHFNFVVERLMRKFLFDEVN